jgi:hypothetical protein
MESKAQERLSLDYVGGRIFPSYGDGYGIRDGRPQTEVWPITITRTEASVRSNKRAVRSATETETCLRFLQPFVRSCEDRSRGEAQEGTERRRQASPAPDLL